MNITFFIGNGFDINLGLKTRYSNFYPYFMEHAKEDNMIRNWIDGNEQLWADLEEQLGQELHNVEEEQLDKFYADKDELDGLLIEYLEQEQEKYSFDDVDLIKKEFSRSMVYFMDELPINDANSIKQTLETYKNEEYVYTYITFNYTNILDRIIGLYEGRTRVVATHQGTAISKSNLIGRVFHAHGTTDAEMILGVNDLGQVKNDFLKENEIFLDTFIKRRMNDGIGQGKTERAFEIIKNSHIICIFGMSIGNTDKMWWEELVRWLVSNENNRLVLFWKGFEDALKRKLPSTVIRLNEQIRNMIFEKGKGKYTEKEYVNIKNRIMISYNANIFALPKVVQNNEGEVQ